MFFQYVNKIFIKILHSNLSELLNLQLQVLYPPLLLLQLPHQVRVPPGPLPGLALPSQAWHHRVGGDLGGNPLVVIVSFISLQYRRSVYSFRSVDDIVQ